MGWDQLGGRCDEGSNERGIIDCPASSLAGSSGDGGDLGIACVFERHSSNLEVHCVYWVGQVENGWGKDE